MPSTPRISILSLHYPPETTGNAPYTGSLARGAQERGLPVQVLTAHPHYPEWSFREGRPPKWVGRENVEGVAVTRFRHFLPRKSGGFTRLLSEVSFGLRLLFARWGRPDVLVLVSPALFSTAIAMLRAQLMPHKPKVVVWVQDLYSLGVTEAGAGGAVVARIMTWIESKTLRAASRVVVIHPRFEAYIADILGVDAQRIEVIRNWTHLTATAAPDVAAARALFGWSRDETIVLHAGNMGGKQGLENVVDSARLADERGLSLRFVLLGDGNQRKHLQEYGAGVSKLQFLEPVGNDEFQAALRAADILLVNEKPGVSEMSVPSKLTSYFDSGRPVIAATDPAGITAAELLAAGGGVVVQSGQPTELIDACLEMRDDPRSAAKFGASGQRFRREVLGQDSAIDRYTDLLACLAGTRGYNLGPSLPGALGGTP